MRKLAFIFLFFTFIHSNAQNRVENIEVGPVFEALITELDDCIKDKERDCLEKANKIIEKGKQENVAFLDYLYFKRSEEHTSELQSRPHLVCRLLLEKKKKKIKNR